MSVKVYVAALDATQLTALMARLRPSAPFAILARPDRVDFPGSSEAIAVDDLPMGRVFGEEVELYWEQESSLYRARLTCTDASLPLDGFEESGAQVGLEQETVWYYLWGEDDVAIGGRLDYSRIIPGRGRAQLGVIEYRDQAGRLLFYRYTGLRREVEDGG